MTRKLESKLGPNLLGLRVLTLGILIAFGGLGIAWLGALKVGWTIALCGIVTTFVGIAINALAVIRKARQARPPESE